MIPIILKSRIPSNEWKRCQLMNDCNFIRSYIYTPNPNDNVECYIYNQNIVYIKQLVEFQQLYDTHQVFDTYGIVRYISELNNILQSQKGITQSMKSKIQSTITNLEMLLNDAFIGDTYIPQVTTDSTYHRLYYHPIYRFPDKIVRALIQKFGLVNRDRFNVIKIDVNGALIRTVLNILQKITNNSLYQNIPVDIDIYSYIADNFINDNILTVDRDELKQNLIVLINNADNIRTDNTIFIQQFIDDIRRYISPNIETVRKYMTVYSNRMLQLSMNYITNGRDDSYMFMYVNLDGGMVIVDRNIELDRTETINQRYPVKIELL